jgi:hypothetical protein
VTLTSNGGTVEVIVRAHRVRWFNIFSFLLGLVTGIVPFVAELLFVFVFFDVVFTARRTPEGRDNRSFLLGLLPGLVSHAIWLTGRL